MVIGKLYKKPRINYVQSRPAAAAVSRATQKALAGRAARSGMARLATQGLSKVGRAVVRGIPYADAAITVGGAAKGLYDYVRGRRGKQRVVGKRITTTKFAGYIPRASKKAGIFDRVAKAGFIIKTEKGYETISTAGDAGTGSPALPSDAQQVLYQAHSTMPSQNVLFACVAALVKKLLNKAGYNIKNYEDIINDGGSYPLKVRLYYKIKDGDIVSTHEISITTTSSFSAHVTAWVNWLESLASTASLPQHFLFFRLYDDFGGWTGAGPQLKCSLDLMGAKFEIHSESEFKIQNRSINASGSSSENVDNVPLKGKFYEYRTNASMFRDYNEPAAATRSSLTTDRFYGVLPKFQHADTVGTLMYKETPLVSQFVGCRKYGDVMIQPGDFKISNMRDKTVISLNRLVQTILAKGYGDPANNRWNQIWLGKTRLFALEKAVSTIVGSVSDGLGVKAGIEHQLTIGAICVIAESKFTSPRIQVQVGEI